MSGKFKMFGKTLPAWLVVGGLVMAASGAGVGTILAGSIVGEMPVTVSQALLVAAPTFPATDDDWTNNAGSVRGVTRDTFTDHHAAPDRSIGVRSDDKTAFQAAAEVDTGDKYLIQVCFKNASDQDLVAQLDLDIPDGIEAEIFGSDEESTDTDADSVNNVRNVTRIGASSWKFIVDSDAEFVSTDWEDCIGIQVKADDTLAPGFYNVKAAVKQIAY